MTTLGPFEGKTQPTPAAGPKDLHECRWEPATHADDSRRLAQRRLPRPAHHRCPTRTTSPTGRATSSSSSATTARPTSSSSAATTPGRPTTAGPTTTRSTPTPRATQGPWADVSFDRPYGQVRPVSSVVNDPLTVGSGEFLPLRVPARLLAGAARLRRHLLLQQRHAHARPRAEVQGVPQRRPRRVLGHPRSTTASRRCATPASTCCSSPATPSAGSRRFSASSDGRPNRIIFRGGPYGGEYKYAERSRARARPVPRARPRRGLPDRAPATSSRSTAAATGSCAKPDHWIFEGTGMKKGDRIPGLIGWEYHGDPPPTSPAWKSSPRARRWQGGDSAAALDRDDLSRPEGQLRLQRLDDLLVAGPELAARPHAALVATGAARTAPTSACSGSPTTCWTARSRVGNEGTARQDVARR